MKHQLSLLFILFCCTASIQAQNYQCLQSGVKHYFTNSQGYLRGIRIDSVRMMGDTTVYYPFHTPRGRYNASGGEVTLDSTGGSWLGKKVLQFSDGTYIFDDEWHDSVIIKTQANLGDSWIFYRDTSNLYYKATVISNDTMTVLGAPDTVKIIEVNAYNGTAILTTDPVNGFQIVLSKSHGFVKAFDLYTFPYHLPNAIYTNGFDYFLDNCVGYPASSSAPNQNNSIFNLVSFINPTIQQLYQWNIGDVYEYASCNGFDGCSPVDYYYLDTITNESIGTDYTEYFYRGLASGLNNLPYSGGYYYYISSASTGSNTHYNSYLLDTFKMPEEYNYIMPNGGYIYGTNRSCFFYYYPNDSSYCLVSPKYEFINNQIIGNQYYAPFEGPNTTITNKIGLGLLEYYSLSFESGMLITEQLLLYYNRSGQYCGDYHPIALGLQSVTKENSIAIFPNPTTTQLTIQSNNDINQVTIANLLGQTVYCQQPNALKVQIDVSGLADGVYFVKVNGSEVRKFVKK